MFQGSCFCRPTFTFTRDLPVFARLSFPGGLLFFLLPNQDAVFPFSGHLGSSNPWFEPVSRAFSRGGTQSCV